MIHGCDIDMSAACKPEGLGTLPGEFARARAGGYAQESVDFSKAHGLPSSAGVISALAYLTLGNESL